MRLLIGWFVFLSWMSLSYAQVSVKGALDNNKILIGDQAVLHLEAKYPDHFSIMEIDLSPLDSIFSEVDASNPDPHPGQLEIISIENWDTLIHNGQVTLRNNIRLTCWKAGVYYIPPIYFRFMDDKGLSRSKLTNQLALLVDSPIADEAAADTVQLAPIKDIIIEPLKLQDFLPYIIGGLVLLGLVLLGIFLYRRMKKKDQLKEITVIKRPAHEIAFEKLEQLKEAKLWQQGMIKAYQSELSYIVREYVENRYEILALESTTDEILRDLKQKDFNEALKDNLREMLQLADLVKFAKAEPPLERHEQLMRFAEEFVLQTKKKPIPENTENLEEVVD